MDNLRWWLLLIAAVMFSMSGCASARDWSTWRERPAHFASNDHLAFSVRSASACAIGDADEAQAAPEGFSGDLVSPGARSSG